MGGLRLREKVRPTAANINLTKPQLLNKKGGQVAHHAATKISAKAMPLHNKTVKYKQQVIWWALLQGGHSCIIVSSKEDGLVRDRW